MVLATPKHDVGDGGTSWGSSTTADHWVDRGVTEITEAELRPCASARPSPG
jgi:beta-glucosidase